MSLLLLAGALAILAIASALGFVVVSALRLRARHRRALSTPLPGFPPDKERLVDSPRALFHGTRFADGKPLLAPAWREPCVADLWCTEDAVFLRREGDARLLWIPISSVVDAELVRAHAPIAGKDLPMLRLRWRRGGELLQTDVSMAGGRESLERLRREIHLRQGAAEQLAPLLSRAQDPGP